MLFRSIRTTLVHSCYSWLVPTRSNAASATSVRQSVTIPASLAADLKRVARDRHLTMSRALVALAQRGIEAEAEARQQLKSACRDFVNEADPARKNEAGRELIKAIFGKGSIAEDSVF